MTPAEERELRNNRAFRLKLEPLAVFPESESEEGFSKREPKPYEAEIEHSKAISLKRIADFCDKFDFWEGAVMVRQQG